jgi:heat shock protein HslJ
LSFTVTEVAGHGGCNGFGGSYQRSADRLTLGPMASTRMFCPGAMEREYGYLTALAAVNRFRIEGRFLMLSGPGGVLARLESLR